MVIPIPAAREERGARQIKGHRRPAAWAMCEGGRCGLERTHKGAEGGGWHAATVVWEGGGRGKRVISRQKGEEEEEETDPLLLLA